MYLLSEITGKTAIDMTDGKNYGAIKGISTDGKLSRITAVVAENGSIGAERVFSVKDAVSINGAETLSGDFPVFAVGKEIFDTTGKKIGRIADLSFSKDKVRRIFTDGEAVFTPSSVYACGDVLLIKARLPKKKKPSVKRETQPAALHKRKCGDFSFLLGRVCDKNIVNFQGELMIKKGEPVTRETLRAAKISGKLIELSLHAH